MRGSSEAHRSPPAPHPKETSGQDILADSCADRSGQAVGELTWTPPGNLRREVFYGPRNSEGPMPSQFSRVAIEYSVSDPTTIPHLVKLAQDASTSFGYSGDGLRQAGDIVIYFDDHAMSDNRGFALVFRAPGN